MSRRNTFIIARTFLEETTAFMTAAGIPNDGTVYFTGTAYEITGAAYWTAINNYIQSSMDAGLWDLRVADYRFIGGTALTCKWNLKNPLDTDAAFRLDFSGGNTFNGEGWTGNGTNGFGNSHVNPLSHLSLNNTHLSIYQRKTSGGISTTKDIGAFTAGANPCISLTSREGLNVRADQYMVSRRILVSGQGREGFFLTSRINSASHVLYKNGSSIGSDLLTNAQPLPNQKIFLMAASSNDTTPVINTYSNATLAGATIGLGLTSSQQADANTIEQAFQTALNRNV